jgi:hypothetical protein
MRGGGPSQITWHIRKERKMREVFGAVLCYILALEDSLLRSKTHPYKKGH